MNERDRDNYAFLMNVPEEVFDDWLSQVDNDDIDYALELFAIARKEISVREKLLLSIETEPTIEPQTEKLLQKYTLH